MPQVSRYKLDKDLEKEMFRQFWISLAKLKDAETVSSFFSDVLTETEEIMLAKRFTIAVLILRGRKPIDIKDTLHVSFSTIGSVGAWLKNAKPLTQVVLQTMIQGSNWQKIIDRVEALLDTLPPRYGTNWQEAGKAKWRRKMARSTRASLR